MGKIVEERQTRHRQFDWHVGNNIRYFRILRQMDQQELARLVDMDNSQLSRAEKGTRSLKFQEALNIAKVLGVKPERLSRKVTNNDRPG